MPEILIEQALYGGQGIGGYRFLAQSPGFLEDWLPEAQRICTAFGERPAGVACPGCIFAQPFGKRHVVVVQVADQGTDDSDRPGTLAFRLLVLSRPDFSALGGDPFLVADRFPPPWHARKELPQLTWPADPLPERTLDEVQRVLKSPESPVLLGGAQALVDGGRLVFERPAPAAELVRSFWLLLPTNVRCFLWPASFAFGNALRFDLVVVPRAEPEEFAGYVTEEQAGDYPQGYYEHNLQIAAEAGDERDVQALFARRSRQETWKLGILLFAICSVLVLAAAWLLPKPAATKKQPATVSMQLDLPPADSYPALSEPDRQRLTEALNGLAKHLGVRHLTRPATAESLLSDISSHLGTPNPRRDPGEALGAGPAERRLRALLWKHGVAAYRDPALNPVELVERLQEKVVAKTTHQKD
jgi:hypothetical protein